MESDRVTFREGGREKHIDKGRKNEREYRQRNNTKKQNMK